MISVRKLLLALLFGAATLPALAQVQYTPPSVTVTNPLDKVTYHYKWQVYVGMAYTNFIAGPQLVQNASLGGVDAQVGRFFTPKWGILGNYRGYFGTSGVEPNYYNIRGPFVSEQFAVFGPEYRLIANKHLSVNTHALFGTAYGDFQRATAPLSRQQVEDQLGLFGNQWTPGAVIGGALTLNRNQHWAFRLEPDATLTRFNNPNGPTGIQYQFALSVGVVYRFVPRHLTPEQKKALLEKKKARRMDHHRSLLHPF